MGVSEWMELDFSRLGKPTDNGLIEAFNGRLRQECQNESWFLSLDNAREAESQSHDFLGRGVKERKGEYE